MILGTLDDFLSGGPFTAPKPSKLMILVSTPTKLGGISGAGHQNI